MAYPKTDNFYHECMALYSFDYSLNKFMEERRKSDVRWKEPAGSTCPYGVRLTIGAHVVLAHHLVWRMTQGEWPTGYQIKHADDNVFNNDPLNLVAPGRNRKRKKSAVDVVDFMKSLGLSERQLKRMQIERVRATLGELEALKLELQFGMISEDQYNDALEVMDNDVKDQRQALIESHPEGDD